MNPREKDNTKQGRYGEEPRDRQCGQGTRETEGFRREVLRADHRGLEGPEAVL